MRIPIIEEGCINNVKVYPHRGGYVKYSQQGYTKKVFHPHLLKQMTRDARRRQKRRLEKIA